MVLKSLKQPMTFAWPALLACTALAACSKTPATPDAYVDALVGGGNGCSTFGSSQTFLQIGTSTNPNSPSTVPDGTGAVSVDCTIAPSGGGYDLQIGASGPAGGKITISGHVTTAGGTVQASFVNATLGAYVANSCTLTYMFNRQNVPSSQAISAGEIFGHIDCAGATDEGGQQNADGTPVTCDASADFLFSNCADGS